MTQLVRIKPLSVRTPEICRLPSSEVRVSIAVTGQSSITRAPSLVAARVRAVQNPAGSTTPSLGLCHTNFII